jgi:hypothetical protein
VSYEKAIEVLGRFLPSLPESCHKLIEIRLLRPNLVAQTAACALVDAFMLAGRRTVGALSTRPLTRRYLAALGDRPPPL